MGGGTGDDTFNGLGGTDQVTYTTNTAAQPIDVTLNDIADDDDGLGGTDNIAADMEYVFGGAGDDTIDASAATQGVSLWGRAGNDTLIGSAENDFLRGELGADTLDCARRRQRHVRRRPRRPLGHRLRDRRLSAVIPAWTRWGLLALACASALLSLVSPPRERGRRAEAEDDDLQPAREPRHAGRHLQRRGDRIGDLGAEPRRRRAAGGLRLAARRSPRQAAGLRLHLHPALRDRHGHELRGLRDRVPQQAAAERSRDDRPADLQREAGGHQRHRRAGRAPRSRVQLPRLPGRGSHPHPADRRRDAEHVDQAPDRDGRLQRQHVQHRSSRAVHEPGADRGGSGEPADLAGEQPDQQDRLHLHLLAGHDRLELGPEHDRLRPSARWSRTWIWETTCRSPAA